MTHANLTPQQPNDQFIPKHSKFITGLPFYYGWVVLVVSVIGSVMTSPGQTYAFSIFIEHFIGDLGISRSVVSTLYMIGTLTASLAMPFVGRQIDKRGPRITVGVVSVLFARRPYKSHVQLMGAQSNTEHNKVKETYETWIYELSMPATEPG